MHLGSILPSWAKMSGAAEIGDSIVFADNAADAIADFYQTKEIDIPGVSPDDWMQVFKS